MDSIENNPEETVPLGAESAVSRQERRERVARAVYALRDRLCRMMEGIEARKAETEPAHVFEVQPWDRRGGGGGGTASWLRGKVFAKACVHVSVVHGELDGAGRASLPGSGESGKFWACGVSVIVHPLSPHAPTAHLNVRRIETTRGWFGGGADLTPMLAARRTGEDPDARAFHREMAACCAKHPGVDYPRYRAWCDRYFYLHHRKEPRGVGGIFFDYHASSDFDADLSFAIDVGDHFRSVYEAILLANLDTPWTDADRQAQCRQRGRYAEFNLLHDRGTLFGLNTGGNIDAILSSLPPVVHWP